MNEQPSPDMRRESLLRDIAALRQTLNSKRECIPYAESLLAILSDAEIGLGSEPYGTSRLREDAFGIFRLVTDSLELEQGLVGKALIEFHGKLRDFVRSVEGNST